MQYLFVDISHLLPDKISNQFCYLWSVTSRYLGFRTAGGNVRSAICTDTYTYPYDKLHESSSSPVPHYISQRLASNQLKNASLNFACKYIIVSAGSATESQCIVQDPFIHVLFLFYIHTEKIKDDDFIMHLKSDTI